MVAEEREGLRKIRRLRFWLWTLLLAFIPLVWLVTIFTESRSVMMGHPDCMGGGGGTFRGAGGLQQVPAMSQLLSRDGSC